MNANPILLQMKYARVVSLFAEKEQISLERALELFYHSKLYQLVKNGVSDMHCMSDEYLVEELQEEMRIKMKITHPIAPVYDADSKILILGSFPSVKSREQQFFYGHKQNRFWKVLAKLLECPVPKTVAQKREMLLKHHIAVWDVIASCEITGSSDASIREVQPNDLSEILSTAKIQAIFANGTKAYELYQKYIYPANGIPAHKLPSTSPANASYSLERLVEAWEEIMVHLD